MIGPDAQAKKLVSAPSADRNGILMVAFHFPPFAGSSGVHRTLNFCRDLRDDGWRPAVLTVVPRAHQRVGTDLLASIPADVPVIRAFALDTARHLSFRNRYLQTLALPDRWVTWLLGAIPAGLCAVRSHELRVIWSTYPIATAHLIGYVLHRLTGLPWLADFRDPMVEQDPRNGAWTPANNALRKARMWIESLAARHATRLVFCSEGARRICAERYGPACAAKSVVIANGYDEENFTKAERRFVPPANTDRPLQLLHSGVIYPSKDRDPTAFVDAVTKLKRQGRISAATVQIKFRATGHDAVIGEIVRSRGCEDIIKLGNPIPYRAALEEMLSADALIVFQGYTSNPAIPAKLYEYIRAGRPVFASVDPEGDTAALVREESLGILADIVSVDDLAEKLAELVDGLRQGRFETPPLARRERFSRLHRARELGALLREVTSTR